MNDVIEYIDVQINKHNDRMSREINMLLRGWNITCAENIEEFLIRLDAIRARYAMETASLRIERARLSK